MRAEHGKLSGTLKNLTAEHQAITHQLRDTETHLSELMAVPPAAMCGCSSDGEITYYNDQAVRLWGLSPKPSDRPWSFLEGLQLPSSDGQSLTSLQMREAIEIGIPVINRELVLKRADGTIVNFLLSVSPLRNSNGASTGAVMIAQDITELKTLQGERELLLQDLQRSNQELAAFSHSVAHDLQAPVRNVRILTQL